MHAYVRTIKVLSTIELISHPRPPITITPCPIWIQTSDQQTYMLAPSNTVIWTSAHSPLPIPGACECPWHWPTPCLAMPTCTCCHPTHTLLQWCPFTVNISRWPLQIKSDVTKHSEELGEAWAEQVRNEKFRRLTSNSQAFQDLIRPVSQIADLAS
jgi:hypothetical protein